jgi:acid phosphatase type 7
MKQRQHVPLLLLLLTLLTSVITPILASADEKAIASDPVIAAAGDIACDPASSSFRNGQGTATSCQQRLTSDLMVDTGLAAVLALGDTQYECGGYQAYLQSYDLSWGRLKSITHPVIGNHEYLPPGNPEGGTDCRNNASGYFNYFGASAGQSGQGYYSYNIGAWHIIALNTECNDAGGCNEGSPQYLWLEQDLQAHPNACILAYWHIPLFSSGGRANNNSYNFWKLLYAAGADVVLTGHDHLYERFLRLGQYGEYDPFGIRQFVVGTGGANHTKIKAVAPGSVIYNDATFGVLRLTLHSNSYDWEFVPVAGSTFTDSGSASCSGDANYPTYLPYSKD